MALSLTEEINRRRTFAIISHPDAGKTTLTEKFLFYRGAIQIAGTLKSNTTKKRSEIKWNNKKKQPVKSIARPIKSFN